MGYMGAELSLVAQHERPAGHALEDGESKSLGYNAP
jgi:hypothetical protein